MTSLPRDPDSSGLVHALVMLARPARFDAREPTHPSVRYAHTARPGVLPLCDVYLPEGEGPHPSVIVVHGGGFVIGHRRMKPVRLVATRLAEAGYAAVAIDYRLLFRGGGLDAQVEDVTLAAAFWRAECARFGCDPTRVSMLGFSAGATLMMLHAARAGHAYHRLVSFYGATDFERVSGRRAELLVRMVMGTTDRRVWRERSPAAQAHVASPLLIIHGTRDALVPVEHAERLHATRVSLGLPTELELVPDMPHGFVNDASLAETNAAVARVLAFLER